MLTEPAGRTRNALCVAGIHAGVALIALGITGICRAVFVHHHPNYKKKAQKAERLEGQDGKRRR